MGPKVFKNDVSKIKFKICTLNIDDSNLHVNYVFNLPPPPPQFLFSFLFLLYYYQLGCIKCYISLHDI